MRLQGIRQQLRNRRRHQTKWTSQQSTCGQPNGLGFSGGALIDRESCRVESRFQKRYDLAGAERRPLQARVRRRLHMSVLLDRKDALARELVRFWIGFHTLI